MAGLAHCCSRCCINLFSLDIVMFRRSCFLLTTIIFAISLVACSSSGKKWNPDDYTVKSGDTVYSISWRYEVDPEDFAEWNDLDESKLIKPGQRLHTRKPYDFDARRNQANSKESSDDGPAVETENGYSSARNSSNGKVMVQKGDSLYVLSKRYNVSVSRLAQLNQLKKPYVIQPGQTIFLQPLNTASRVNKKTINKATTNSAQKKSDITRASTSQKTRWPNKVRWQRPVNGKIIKKFDRRRNDAKGIDIAGKLGNAIVAAADGKVVYSGDGLISYGNLIIIKHNRTYLSAYAYNHKLLVKEGESIKAGQKIAEMGRKDNLSPRLHFEIRKNGKPVDPLKYLPR